MSKPYKISVPVLVVKRRDLWIAYCPFLKLYGYSEQSKDAAKDDFDKAIDTFFEIHATLGTLNQALLSLGWTRGNDKVNAPTKNFNSQISPFRNPDKVEQSERQIAIPA